MQKDVDIYFEAIDRFNRVVEHLRRFNRVSRDYGTGDVMGRAEIHGIVAVGEAPLISVTSLSNKLGVTKGAVSQLVGKLAKNGYIRKLKSVDNGREVLLALTEKGETARQGHNKIHQAIYEKYLSEITVEEAESFIEVLKKIETFTVFYRDGKSPV